MKEFHPLANVFPLMDGDEFAALKRDITEHGLLEPICLHEDGSIIDGRNRYRACMDTGTEPDYWIWDGVDHELLPFILSLNLHRRHLTSSQLAVVALDIEEALAKQTMVGRPSKLSKELDNYSPLGRASHQAAAMVGTNNNYVSQAKKLATEAPDLLEEVREGTVSLPQATRQIKQEQRRHERIERIQELSHDAQPLTGELGKFPIIYADPPWRYEHVKTDNRAIENQYPTMSLEDICNLPVSQIATRDAVLFLWATSPKLREAMDVIDSWGFTYRTSIVWVKDKIGMGYYARSRHEFLLIATRGSVPVPQPAFRYDSVLEAPRVEHSKKPTEAYKRIEMMYPEYKKIELFNRSPREGWQVWGYES